MLTYPNAKINIGLNITEKRNDGFHNIETVFCPIGLCDALEFVVSDALKLSNSGIEVDSPAEDNLVYKTYNLLAQDFHLLPLHIHLHKKIPFGAGLGGGSADAAFMAKMLNEDFNLKLSDAQLEDYVRQLGSDCAFFIRNKPTFAYEKGDRFRAVNLDLSNYHLLLINPGIHVPTKDAYAGVQPQAPEVGLEELIQQPIETWKETIVNDFEQSVFAKYPEIERLKQSLYDHGAVYAAMSGSGSSVFGLFSEKPAEHAEWKKYFVWEEKLTEAKL